MSIDLDPASWGQSYVIRGGTLAVSPAGVRWSTRMLDLPDVSSDGAPLRATVGSTWSRLTNGGLVSPVCDLLVTAGVGGTSQQYRIDAGSSLSLNADALRVEAVLRENQGYDASLRVSLARWGDAVGKWTWGSVDVAPGTTELVEPVPPGARRVFVVPEEPTADLTVRLGGPATILWSVPGTYAPSLMHGMPVGPCGADFVQLILDGGHATSVRCMVQWEIAA